MERKNLVIWILALAIILLLVIFFVRPGINNYLAQKQEEGVQMAVYAILYQVQQNGYTQINVGNQTVILVPYNPGNSTG